AARGTAGARDACGTDRGTLPLVAPYQPEAPARDCRSLAGASSWYVSSYNARMNDLIELQRAHLARHLRKHLQGEVRFDAASRKLYSTDASIYQIEPLGVVLPRTPDDVRAAVQ